MQAADSAGDYLSMLNPAQRQAAEYGQRAAEQRFKAGPLLVIAGAGTGKTMTLAHRVAHLVVEGVSPERILLLTFTRRAAETVARRVDAIVRSALAARRSGSLPAAVIPWAGTFHSVGNRLLREFAVNLGLDPAFSVLDRGDSADVIDVIRHDLGLSKKKRRFPGKDTCLGIYSRCVNSRRPLDAVLDDAYPWCADWEAELKDLFRRYTEHKQAIQALDYDDLLLYWSHLVADPELGRQIGSWFDHILVDEYQDTNLVQAEILKALKPDGDGVTVVGDDAQSIYSFRAAEVENILRFPDQFMPAAQVIALEQNYRSTQQILDSANRVIAQSERQYRKDLFTDNRPGARPSYVTVEDGDAEAEYVVAAVLENREAGMPLKEQAVLFRGAHHSDRLEIELMRRNIPYVKYGGLKFLEAAHVKDVLSVLRWADNRRNQVAAFRVLKLLPGMGPALAARCFSQFEAAGFRVSALREFRPPAAAADDWPALCTLMESLASEAAADPLWHKQLAELRRWYQPHLERLYDGFDTRSADLEQLEQISGRYATRERFLTELTLDPPNAAGDLAGDPLLDEDYLVLSTVHSAKGQEWDAVYVLNVSDGNFPSEFATGKPAMIEEERRLLYVAMTRARQTLALVAPLRYHLTQQRRDGDRHVYGARSRFLTDAVLDTMERDFFGRSDSPGASAGMHSDKRIDVASRMREMW